MKKYLIILMAFVLLLIPFSSASAVVSEVYFPKDINRKPTEQQVNKFINDYNRTHDIYYLDYVNHNGWIHADLIAVRKGAIVSYRFAEPNHSLYLDIVGSSEYTVLNVGGVYTRPNDGQYYDFYANYFFPDGKERKSLFYKVDSFAANDLTRFGYDTVNAIIWNLFELIPVGIAILAILLGVYLIPRIIRKFF